MKPTRLRSQLAAITLARAGINTGFRMVYPFLPAIARGLGVESQAIIFAVTSRSALGIGAPLLGSVGDARGRKLAMLLGVGVFAVGMALVGAWPSYPAFFLAMLAISMSKFLFDPAELAYLGDRVAYERRGLAIGISEFGWSGAYLVGVPLVGWLMDRSGWAAPFPFLAAVLVMIGLWLWRTLAPDRRGESAGGVRAGLRAVRQVPSAMATLAVGLLIAAGNEGVAIVYGLWMEGSFGLHLTALGAASAVIGFAELGGEGLVAGFVDRLGKRRAVAAGILSTTAASLALPVLGTSLAGALVGLFLLYLSFEFTIVSSLPLISEQIPHARATLLSFNITSFSLGRTVGALIGGPLFRHGLAANAAAAAALNLLALAALLLFVREGEAALTGPERG